MHGRLQKPPFRHVTRHRQPMTTPPPTLETVPTGSRGSHPIILLPSSPFGRSTPSSLTICCSSNAPGPLSRTCVEDFRLGLGFRPPLAAMATFAEAPKGNEKAGEKIFKTKCAQCHVVEKGAGHKQGEKRIVFFVFFWWIWWLALFVVCLLWRDNIMSRCWRFPDIVFFWFGVLCVWEEIDEGRHLDFCALCRRAIFFFWVSS